MTSNSEEALLLSDIASLAALINQHKQPTFGLPSAYHKRPIVSHNKKFTNLSLKPQVIPTSSPTIATTTNNTFIKPPTPLAQQQQLIHKNPYKLVKPKPNIPPSSIPTIIKPIKPPTPNSAYIRRGNKLVRKSTLKIISQHKKFILHSPSANKSISSSPSLRIKQHLLQAAHNNAGFYRRQISLNPSLASKGGVSLLTSYFRRGNSLVRKDANKYIRPGAIITPKKPLVRPNVAMRTPKGNRMTLDGQLYIKTPRGRSLVRSKKLISPQSISKPTVPGGTPSSAVMGRVIASNRVKRSLKLARTKKVQYCLFFNKFGKCNKKETCRYLHDKEKVAVCRAFLKGKCEDPNCLLQHKIDSDRMPMCWHFLRGVCNKDNCPYSHVYVNPQASICPDFQTGFCPLGKLCKLKHVDVKHKKDTEIEKEKETELENVCVEDGGREKRKREEDEKREEVEKRRREERPNFSAFFGNKDNVAE